MEFTLFDTLIVVLSIAVAVVVLCKYLKIPPIIGYIVVGIISGPHIMAWLPDTKGIQGIAEFGIVFLMFTIGLEFSLSRILKMKHLVFGLGSAQVLLTGFVTAIAGYWLSLNWDQAVALGCIVALSSTAIVSKQLVDENELNSEAGHQAISILLLQDLAVIPFFILISRVASSAHTVGLSLAIALMKTVLIILLIVGLGRWILRPLFKAITVTHSQELFTLSVLLVTVASSWITHRLGLSLALGSFMAGMMLGETEFRHQIEASIKPFRDLLLGLFFITVGMLLNTSSVATLLPWILLLFMALTGLKAIIITVLSRLIGSNWMVSLRSGIILAQGGEFGFALLTLSLNENIFSALYGQVILGALLFSMMTSPFFIHFNAAIAKLLLPKSALPKAEFRPVSDSELLTKSLTGHVVLCGFGRNGQNIAKLLQDENIPYIAIDADHELVLNCQTAGFPVIYGDASQYAMLVACHVEHATAMVISFEEIPPIKKILPQVRAHFKNLPIFVRAHDDASLEEFINLGATEVIPGSLETSLTLASHLLITTGVSAKRVLDLMNKIRKTRYRMLREVIPGEEI